MLKNLSEITSCAKKMITFAQISTHLAKKRMNSYSMTYSLFDLYLRNGAPPLRVAAVEALHHPITALSVGIHRVLSVMSYFILRQLATR